MPSSTILSDNGVSSGTSGIKTSGGNDGLLLLQTTTAGGTATTAVTVDTSQNVGIGTSSPGAKLEVAGGISTGTTNNYVRVNQAYFSSGGDFVNIGNNTWYNGSVFTSSANGGLYQIGGQQHLWFTQTSNAFTQVAGITAAGLFQFNSGYGSVATAYGCRAWVNFNGTGVVAIRASGNVTSITDNGTGDYTVNFTTALVDANYATVVTSRYVSGAVSYPLLDSSVNPTTTAVRVVNQTYNSSGYTDTNYFNVAVFR